MTSGNGGDNGPASGIPEVELHFQSFRQFQDEYAQFISGEGIFIGPKGYGNAGSGLFDAPAQKTWDFALFKEFTITETQKVQFRWESFNFLNTPQFSAPNRNVSICSRINSAEPTLPNSEQKWPCQKKPIFSWIGFGESCAIRSIQ